MSGQSSLAALRSFELLGFFCEIWILFASGQRKGASRKRSTDWRLILEHQKQLVRALRRFCQATSPEEVDLGGAKLMESDPKFVVLLGNKRIKPIANIS